MADLIKRENNSLATQTGFGIEGLEEVPVSILPIPFLRLVQPTSTKVELISGKEAAAGNYFYNDTQEETDSLKFVLLKAKVGQVTFERDGESVESTKLNLLGYDLDRNKVFILQLSVMSFSNFGKLVAQMKAKNVTKSYEYAIVGTSIKQENERGKYYVANFSLGDKIAPKVLTEMEEKAQVFGVALNRNVSETNSVDVEVATPAREEEKTISADDLTEDERAAGFAAPAIENDTVDPTPIKKGKEEAVGDEDLPF